MEWLKTIKKWFKKISFRKAFTNNFWLKVISLIMAVIVWYYVGSEITRGIQI